MKNKIRVSLVVSHKIKNKRAKKEVKMSARRWHYVIDIEEKKDIDKELLNWLKDAYNSRNRKP